MAESEGEIEYLDEDADVVMQCVQQVRTTYTVGKYIPQTQPLLLVERPPPSERKKRKKEDDSDYDPSEEYVIKKKQPLSKKGKTFSTYPVIRKTEPSENYKDVYLKRKRLCLRMPDYDDPLCLPVRAVRLQESDKKRLANWNNACLEHFKFSNDLLKPEKGKTKGSVRTAVFKNVVNKQTGSVETTICSKTTVESSVGDKKSEIFQCVLPRYREKKVLDNYLLGNRKGKSAGHKTEVVLCKEDLKDGEALVVYNPNESVSAVYDLVDKRKEEDIEQTEHKRYIRELTTCKVCPSCYQASYRPNNKQSNNKTLVCPVCARTYVSVYNLLSHFKTHSAMELEKYKKLIGTILSDVVSYHYKCRICRLKFDSIKLLRQHTLTHQSSEVFMCEIGNHLVNAEGNIIMLIKPSINK